MFSSFFKNVFSSCFNHPSNQTDQQQLMNLSDDQQANTCRVSTTKLARALTTNEKVIFLIASIFVIFNHKESKAFITKTIGHYLLFSMVGVNRFGHFFINSYDTYHHWPSHYKKISVDQVVGVLGSVADLVLVTTIGLDSFGNAREKHFMHEDGYTAKIFFGLTAFFLFADLVGLIKGIRQLRQGNSNSASVDLTTMPSALTKAATASDAKEDDAEEKIIGMINENLPSDQQPEAGHSHSAIVSALDSQRQAWLMIAKGGAGFMANAIAFSVVYYVFLHGKTNYIPADIAAGLLLFASTADLTLGKCFDASSIAASSSSVRCCC